MSDLADFLDDRCARFGRDARYRLSLMRERYLEEAITAEARRRGAGYKKRKKESV